MDGVFVYNPAELTEPWGPKARPLGKRARNVLLMAGIVALTFVVLLVLDQAGIQLPEVDELLAVPPFG